MGLAMTIACGLLALGATGFAVIVALTTFARLNESTPANRFWYIVAAVAVPALIGAFLAGWLFIKYFKAAP